MKGIIGMLCVAVMFMTVSVASAEDAAKIYQLPGDMTSELADIAVDAAIKEAKKQGTLMIIAVVDAGNNLKVYHRMDGAGLACGDIAFKKAFTARGLNKPTSQLAVESQPGEPTYGIEVTNGGLIIFGGGELIKDKNGIVIGAIGVSGDTVENDIACAKAGVAAVLEASKQGK